jgi:uncharacterized protein
METDAKFVHEPAGTPVAGFVLTHGAGGNANAPSLVALANALSGKGFVVVRYNLPYRQQRPFGPPRPGDAVNDRAGLRNEVEELRKKLGTRVFLGGHSYGGRQASMLCAEEPKVADGLLLMSYPLHPPGKPEQPRTKHLSDLRLPCLFVHGTHDPFGSTQEMEAALKLIAGKTKLLSVERAGHDLGFKGKSRREELPALILSEFQKLIA